jgi:hypothetical protein
LVGWGSLDIDYVEASPVLVPPAHDNKTQLQPTRTASIPWLTLFTFLRLFLLLLVIRKFHNSHMITNQH